MLTLLHILRKEKRSLPVAYWKGDSNYSSPVPLTSLSRNGGDWRRVEMSGSLRINTFVSTSCAMAGATSLARLLGGQTLEGRRASRG